jgi:hypothetical protein
VSKERLCRGGQFVQQFAPFHKADQLARFACLAPGWQAVKVNVCVVETGIEVMAQCAQFLQLELLECLAQFYLINLIRVSFLSQETGRVRH